MLKKILIGIGVLILVFVLYSVYALFIAEPVSPPAIAKYSDQGLDIKVEYSQPSKKGRVIFGTEKEEALQSYGTYWRLGANSATEITFSKNVVFANQSLKAGTYRMYAVPYENDFEVSLNSELGVFFAAWEPDYDLDVLKIMAPVTRVDVVETFEFRFSSEEVPRTPDEPFSDMMSVIYMDFVWDTALVRIPITVE